MSGVGRAFLSAGIGRRGYAIEGVDLNYSSEFVKQGDILLDVYWSYQWIVIGILN